MLLCDLLHVLLVNLDIPLGRTGVVHQGKGPPLAVGRPIRVGPVNQLAVVHGQVTRLEKDLRLPGRFLVAPIRDSL